VPVNEAERNLHGSIVRAAMTNRFNNCVRALALTERSQLIGQFKVRTDMISLNSNSGCESRKRCNPISSTPLDDSK
jgi:hypothetical protein